MLPRASRQQRRGRELAPDDQGLQKISKQLNHTIILVFNAENTVPKRLFPWSSNGPSVTCDVHLLLRKKVVLAD
jgi:S-adenosylmethionine:tRNA-ribosyltransferase-isomerase (queuine synthetase)